MIIFDVRSIISILVFLICVLLSIYILYRSNKDKVKVIFGLFVGVIAFWILATYFVDTVNDHGLALTLSKIVFIGPILIPALLLHFSLVFPIELKKISLAKLLLIYITPVFLLSVLPSKLFVENVSIESWGTNFLYGKIQPLFSAYFIIFVILSFFFSIRKYRSLANIDKLRVKYVFVGILISAAIAIITNIILPLLAIQEFSYIGIQSIIFFISFTYYSIVKFRLLNIRLIITRSILYAVLVASVASFFALTVVTVGSFIGGNTLSSRIVTYLIDSLIVVIGLPPLRRTLARITDRIFFKDKVDYQAVLREASLIAAREIDLERLLGQAARLLDQQLKIKKVLPLVANDGSYDQISTPEGGRKKYEGDKSFTDFIRQSKSYVITEELLRDLSNYPTESEEYRRVDNIISQSQEHNVEMIVPISKGGKTVAAFLLSAKNSGDLYGDEDIKFFDVLIPQIATAIEKSNLYEEVQRFNVELQAKVEERTKSLQATNIQLEERNKFLTTMQVVINLVSRTLDLKKIYQLIADSIASELGYIGGLLSFVDPEKNALRFAAVTRSPATEGVVQTLPKDPKAYESKLEYDFNLSTQTVLQGRINFSDKISDFLSPPVEPVILDKIQEVLGVKTVVGVPIFSEAKVIGIVRYFIGVEKKKISSLDIEIMTALANQIGIVSRNLRLYNNLQKANLELQEANIRLRELDKAKSEFLSIASHQLRTPISAIKGYLSMIMEGDFGEVPEKINKIIKDIFESSSRLARLINVFLNVSRIESGRLKLELKPLQITELIDSVIKELGNQASQKGVDLTFERPAKEPPLVNADSDKLREVILNLIDNSIKYTPQGSINASISFDRDNLKFKVEDTGIGIDPNEVQTLFRKFVRGSGVAQVHTGGSGLGLFIAQKIIKEHGGQIWAESDGKGKGSRFQFVIPIYKEEKKLTEGGIE